MKQFARKGIIPKDIFGLDSIQGLLELALWYEDGDYIQFHFNASDSNKSHSLLTGFKQLEKEGYITLQLVKDAKHGFTLRSLVLTIKGHKLLKELKDMSTTGKFKNRLGDLLWVIITATATTLVILWLNGNL